MPDQTDIPASPWLRIPEAARRLRCSRSTVFRLMAAGELPAYRTGQLVRLHVDDVDAVLLRGRQVA